MNYSLYFHIPFCVHRCSYCDFNTYAGQEDLIPAYIDALRNEIKIVADRAPDDIRIHSLFFGGGTPSLLSIQQMSVVMETLRSAFPLTPDLEISLEANPGTVSFDSLRKLHHLGFNRISFGVQSTHPEELRQLGRIHNFFEVIESIKWARQTGFDNLNLDLIYGLPEQTLDRWQTNVKLALDMQPEHLSLYSLTVEQGTPFGKWAGRGLLPTPDPDAAADMYEWAEEALAVAGYEHYEISNWAKPGRECRHNLHYWRNQPYLGFGAGAHGWAAGVRYSNVLRINHFIERMSSPISQLPFPLSQATIAHHRLSQPEEMQETMMVGLRLTQEGILEATFRERFGRELRDVFGIEVDELERLGLLEWVGNRQVSSISKISATPCLRLTKRGRLLGNQVFMRFVG